MKDHYTYTELLNYTLINPGTKDNITHRLFVAKTLFRSTYKRSSTIYIAFLFIVIFRFIYIRISTLLF